MKLFFFYLTVVVRDILRARTFTDFVVLLGLMLMFFAWVIIPIINRFFL
mgnify:CR=1 FL=1